MMKRTKHLITIILLSMLVLATDSCARHDAVWKELDMAEDFMNTRPDSALALLENIPASNVKGKETAARCSIYPIFKTEKSCTSHDLHHL